MVAKDLYSKIQKLYNAEQYEYNTRKLNKLEETVSHCDFDKSTAFVAEAMKQAGFEQVERIAMKADGVTSAFDAVMPEAWDLTGRSYLEVVGDWPEDTPRLLADTDEIKFAVGTWCGSTPAEGSTGEVVVFDPNDYDKVRGKWVFYDGLPKPVGHKLYEAGALGIISTDLTQGEDDPDATRWMNGVGRWGWYYLKDEPHIPVFSITARRSKALLGELEKGHKVTVRGVINTRIYEGEIYTVTGVIPGESDEEFALFAHLYEPFLFDDACGFAACVEIGRMIKELKLKSSKTLRVVFSMEHYGFAQYLNSRLADGKILAALNMDGVASLVYRELGDPLSLRKSPVCNPFFGELLMQALLADLTPELRWKGEYGSLSDDTFGSDPMINIPTNWLMTPSNVYHHTSGRLFADVDWDLSGEMIKLQTVYLAFMLSADKVDMQNSLERFKQLAQLELDEKDTPFARKVKCDFMLDQLLSCNRIVPGSVDAEDIKNWVDQYRLPDADLPVDNAVEAEAAKLVVLRKQIGSPWSLARIPLAEKRKFAYAANPLHIALFDGRRSVLEAVKTANVFNGNSMMSEAKLQAMLDFLYYMEKYGYWQIVRR